METLATPGVNTLIIQSAVDGQPYMFVPRIIVSEDHDKLWHHMNKMFNTKLSNLHDDENIYLHRSFIDSTSACIDHSSTDDGKEHYIQWTICRSELL